VATSCGRIVAVFGIQHRTFLFPSHGQLVLVRQIVAVDNVFTTAGCLVDMRCPCEGTPLRRRQHILFALHKPCLLWLRAVGHTPQSSVVRKLSLAQGLVALLPLVRNCSFHLLARLRALGYVRLALQSTHRLAIDFTTPLYTA
jgi:hypothetical protein